MIYKNEDGSIYKIEYKGNIKEIAEIDEVLNYLLKEIKDIKTGENEPIKPVEPSKVPGTEWEPRLRS